MTWAPVRLFAVVGLLVGLVLAVAVPAMSGFDEEDHYLRAWQVSHGSLLGVRHGRTAAGGSVPVALAAVTSTDAVLRGVRAKPRLNGFAGFGGRIDTSRRVFVDFRNTAGYSPVPYLPAAVVMRVGEAAGVSARGLLVLGRLAQVMAFVLLVAGAAALYRPGAPLFLAVGLLPAAMVQAATLSADPVTTGVACLVVASVLAGLRSPRPAGETVGLAVALALCKPIYVLLVLGYLLPSSAGTRWWRRVLPVAAGGVVAAGWAALAQAVYLPLQPLFGAQGRVDPTRQRQLVGHDPGRFVGAAARTVWEQGGDILRAAVAHLTRADLAVPLVLVVLLWVLLVAIPVTAPGLVDGGPSKGARLLLPAVAVVGTVVLVFFLYLQSTEVGGRTVFGVQGRYLIPFLPAILLAVPAVLAARVRWTADRHALASVGTAAVLLVAATAFALT